MIADLLAGAVLAVMVVLAFGWLFTAIELRDTRSVLRHYQAWAAKHGYEDECELAAGRCSDRRGG